MTKHAHKGQILPIINQMIPINKETTFHASYDYGLHGFKQEKIVYPLGGQWAYNFDGLTSKVYLPIGNGINPYTQKIEIKMKVRLDSTKDQMVLAADRTVTGSDTRLMIGVYGAKWTLGMASNTWTVNGAVAAVVNKWVDVYMIAEKGNARLYIDGVLSESKTYTSYIIDNLGLGWNNGYGDYTAKCAMYDVEVILDGVTIGLYKMSEKEGPIAFDTSDNGNDGLWGGSITSTYGPIVAALDKAGKFGGAVRIEPEATNMLTIEDYYVYNNYSALTTKVKLDETYLGQPIWRFGFTVTDATAQWLYHYQSYLSGHGVYLDNRVWKENTNYVSSIYWRPVNKPDMGFGGVASNTNGWVTGQNIKQEDGWTRYYRYRTGAGVADKLDYVHHSFACPSLQLNETIYFDVTCAQTEEGRLTPTSYVPNGMTRPTGKLWYTKDVVNLSAFTISCWFNIPMVHKESDGNLGIGGTWYHPIIEIATPTRNVQSFGVAASPVLSPYLRKIRLTAPGAVVGNAMIQDDTWYHLVATFDGTTYCVYINGLLEVTHTAPPMKPIQEEVLMVGGGYQGKPNILIDELRIESRAITIEEVQAWAASGLHYNYLDYTAVVE